MERDSIRECSDRKRGNGFKLKKSRYEFKLKKTRYEEKFFYNEDDETPKQVVQRGGCPRTGNFHGLAG